MSVLTLLGVLAILIAINAFFVLAEFVSISVPLVQLEEVSDSQAWAARLYQTLTDCRKRDRFIVVAQLGVTVASLVLGMYSEHELAELLSQWLSSCGINWGSLSVHALSSGLAIALVTYLHVVLGEMIPKRLAIDHAFALARFVEGPMRFCGWLFKPLVWLLNDCISNGMLRMFHLPLSQNVESYSPEELAKAIEESSDKGQLDDEVSTWCQNLLELDDRAVIKVMTPRVRVKFLSSEATLAEALKVVDAEEYSRYPVYEGDIDHIVGMVHVRDMIKARLEGKHDITMGQIMRECKSIPEILSIDKALELMRRDHLHMLAVIDELGGTSGLVTMEDLVEDIFGEVLDEFDEGERQPIEAQSDGLSWKVEGSVDLDDLNEEIDANIGSDEEDVTTLGGLVMAQLERLPKSHDVVTCDNVYIEVLEINNMVPSLCLVKKIIVPEKKSAPNANKK